MPEKPADMDAVGACRRGAWTMLLRVMPAVLRSVSLFAALGLAPAAEVRLADLALLAETRPTGVSWQWDDRLGTRHGEGSFDDSTAIGAGLRWGWGGAGQSHLLITATDLLWERTGWDGATIEGPMLRFAAGYGWAVHDRWLLHGGPELAVGMQRLDRSSAQSDDLAMRGSAWQAGLTVGLRWSLDQRWSLDAVAGWQTGRTRLEGDGAALDLDSAGLRGGLALGFTIDPRPRLLE